MINKALGKWFGSTERKQQIWTHYKERALGNGHTENDVTSCREDHCRIFA